MITADKPKSRYKNIQTQWTGARWSYIVQVGHKRKRYCLGSFPYTPQGEQGALARIVQFKNNLPAIDCIEALRTGRISDEYKTKLWEAFKGSFK